MCVGFCCVVDSIFTKDFTIVHENILCCSVCVVYVCVHVCVCACVCVLVCAQMFFFVDSRAYSSSTWHILPCINCANAEVEFTVQSFLNY